MADDFLDPDEEAEERTLQALWDSFISHAAFDTPLTTMADSMPFLIVVRYRSG